MLAQGLVFANSAAKLITSPLWYMFLRDTSKSLMRFFRRNRGFPTSQFVIWDLVMRKLAVFFVFCLMIESFLPSSYPETFLSLCYRMFEISTYLCSLETG